MTFGTLLSSQGTDAHLQQTHQSLSFEATLLPYPPPGSKSTSVPALRLKQRFQGLGRQTDLGPAACTNYTRGFLCSDTTADAGLRAARDGVGRSGATLAASAPGVCSAGCRTNRTERAPPSPCHSWRHWQAMVDRTSARPRCLGRPLDQRWSRRRRRQQRLCCPTARTPRARPGDRWIRAAVGLPASYRTQGSERRSFVAPRSRPAAGWRRGTRMR